MKKVALDLVDLQEECKYILLWIGCYKRFVLGEVIENKKGEPILNIIRRWCEAEKPEEFITD